jgi:hypothetical protein
MTRPKPHETASDTDSLRTTEPNNPNATFPGRGGNRADRILKPSAHCKPERSLCWLHHQRLVGENTFRDDLLTDRQYVIGQPVEYQPGRKIDE